MKTFEERFTALYPAIAELSRKYARGTNVPSEEYESYLCEEFIKVDKAFDPSKNDSYRAFVISMLDVKAKTIANPKRAERRFYDSIQYIDLPDVADEETQYPSELVSDVDIESTVFDVMFVEEQLAKADAVTRKVLAAFFADPHASLRDIEKATGVPRMTVKRKLEAAAKAVRDA